ncbi:MAG: hypothetical protein Q7K45_05920 [Nanoarchaeota archaeon]|nr:hypothetical protein [Nanoarchaeota archaeon]
MIISFFEEFPSGQNLKRVQYLSQPTKLYIAANSVTEFRKIVSNIKSKNVREFIYWPILKRKEGYWISPFSERKALLRIFQELDGKDIPVMLDLELPTTRNPFLYITQLLNFGRNKRLIRKFIEQYQADIYLAEYYPEGKISERALELLGLHYVHQNVKIIKMFYRSMHHFSDDFLRKELQRGKQEYGARFIPSFGVIMSGIMGNEPVLSPKQLEHDLQIAKKVGIKEVIVFRLGGLEKEYGKVLKKFS